VDPDRALVDEARKGNQEAFADLVRRYQARVYNMALASTANEADAEDAAQEVFVKVFRGLGSFRGESTFRTWLYRVAVNVFRSEATKRRQGRWFGWLTRRADDGDADGGDLLDTLPAPGSLEAAVMDRDAIDRALRRLPSDLRIAVALRDVEGLEYKEIADVLRVPIGTVMSRIARGREKLRGFLRADAPEERGGRSC
jgi:RNA polymerase sigma-70 factor, ECF subfamily